MIGYYHLPVATSLSALLLLVVARGPDAQPLGQIMIFIEIEPRKFYLAVYLSLRRLRLLSCLPACVACLLRSC